MAVPSRIGRYAVELLLGDDGAGRVFLGRDPILRRQVAIRVARDAADDGGRREPADDGGRGRREPADGGPGGRREPADGGPGGRREPADGGRGGRRDAETLVQGAQAGAALGSPVFLAVLDAGDDDDLGPFVVFELGRGPSLRERLAGGRLSKAEVASFARTIAGALTQAHAAGVAHGNLRAENVLFTPAGCRLAGWIGAPAATHAAADQRALAATVYEALTGRPGAPAVPLLGAAEGPPPGSATSRAAAWPPDLRSCPNLDAIFERALAADPARQFSSCDIFAGALAASLETTNAPVLTPVSQASLVSRTTRRWQNVAAAAGVAIIVVLLAVDRQPHARGLSLKAVAASFASAAATRNAPRHPHAAGATTTTAAASSARADASGRSGAAGPDRAVPAPVGDDVAGAGRVEGAGVVEPSGAASGLPAAGPSAR